MAPDPRADEIKRLQSQLDQMKERLDFISPMLPLVSFVQDYFQKVECEASVQLMRLKHANVYSHPENREDAVGNAQVETVKWLHFMTDVVMQLHTGSAESQRVSQHGADQGAATPSTASLGGAQTPSGASEASRGTGRSSAPSHVSPRQRQAQPQRGSGQASPGKGLESAPGPAAGQFLLRDERSKGSGEQTLLPDLASRVSAMSSGAAPGAGDRWAQERAGPSKQAVEDHRAAEAPPAAFDPLTLGSLEQSSSLSGLVLGRGSWATAYRQATGQRRDALRLLCVSGIVTARELSDDLTVISEEHIDECVSIAAEMLQAMPLDMWSRQPQEAKAFFEARLTALYQRKFVEAQR